jgi:hypothetical protein
LFGDEDKLNGGCGDDDSELDEEVVCDCCSLFNLKYNNAESAGEDI